MNALVDTHIFLWALSEPERLNASHRDALVNPANRVWLSSVSVAEIMIKKSTGKLSVDFEPIKQASIMGLELLDFTAEDAMGLGYLPFHHRDPFDRMLIVQSLNRRLHIITEDQKFASYDCDLIAIS